MENPIVITEPISGIAGCFIELLDDVFNGWFEEMHKLRIAI